MIDIFKNHDVTNHIESVKITNRTYILYVNKQAYLYIYNTLENCLKRSNLILKAVQIYFFILWYNQTFNSGLQILQDVMSKNMHCHRDTLRKLMNILSIESFVRIDKSCYYTSLTKLLKRKSENKNDGRQQRPEYLNCFEYTAMPIDLNYSEHSECSDNKPVVLTYDFSKEFYAQYILNKKSTVSSTLHTESTSEDIESIKNVNTVDIPYNELVLDIPIDVQLSDNENQYLNLWRLKGSNQAYVDSGNRIYHTFHQSHKSVRQYFKYNGQSVVEAYDIPTSVFLLSTVLMKKDTSIPDDELQKYYKLVKSGLLYDEICTYQFGVGWTDQYSICRAQVKETLQSYRNSTRPGSYAKYDEYFKTNFPCIREWFKNYECRYKESKKEQTNRRKSKLLQQDYARVETALMLDLHNKLLDNDIQSFPLYDALYLKESDNTLEIRKFICEYVFNWIECKIC